MAPGPHVILFEGQLDPAEPINLLLDPGPFRVVSSVRMLNLQSVFNLKEIELGRARRMNSTVRHSYTGWPRDSLRRITDGLARSTEATYGVSSNNLLETPLDRTFPLEQVNDVSEGIAKHLNLDVPRPFHEHSILEAPVNRNSAVLRCRLRHGIVQPARSRTMRMPLPPPPADGLTRSGAPIVRARCRNLADRPLDCRPAQPGIRFARRNARAILSPISSIASATANKNKAASSTARAKAAIF